MTSRSCAAVTAITSSAGPSRTASSGSVQCGEPFQPGGAGHLDPRREQAREARLKFIEKDFEYLSYK
jgi:hypothetical protein